MAYKRAKGSPRTRALKKRGLNRLERKIGKRRKKIRRLRTVLRRK